MSVMIWLNKLTQQRGIRIGLSGALMTLAFAPFFLWPLALLSLAMLYRQVVIAKQPRYALVAALFWGLGHYVTALYWLPRAFYLDANRSLVAGILGGIPALLGLALYGALLVGLVAWTARKAPERWRAPVFIGMWILVEFLRSLTPYGFPWLPVGAVWAGSIPLMQSAAWVGVQGMSLIMVSLAVMLAQPTAARWRVAAGILLAVYVAGWARVGSVDPDRTVEGPLIRVVQPNIQSAHKWDTVARVHYLQETINLALGPGGSLPDVVILPETAVAFYLQDDPELRAALASRLRPGQEIVTGTVSRDATTLPHRFYNSIGVLGADGGIYGWYDKRLLVPFGEFIPLREWVEKLPLPGPVRTLSQSRLDYTAGERTPALATAAGIALPLICYEGIFPYHVAAASARAHYLLNITNDNWFTGTIALAQHASLERLRAVETGLPLVRAANTGLTLVTDAYGRTVVDAPANQPLILDVPLPPAIAGGTVFARLVASLVH